MRISLILAAAVLAAGCSLPGETRSIVVEFSIQDSWESLGLEEPWHLITWPDSRGTLRSLRTSPGASRAVLDLPKGADVPVLVRPYGKYPGYGGWAEADEASRTELSSEFAGFAELLVELWQTVPDRCAALRLSYWGKTLQELRDEAVGQEADFRMLRFDRRQARISIITGELSAESLRLLPAAAQRVEFPEAGLWYLREEPSRQFSLSSNIGTVVLPYPGVYPFVNADSGNEAAVVMDREGRAELHQ